MFCVGTLALAMICATYASAARNPVGIWLFDENSGSVAMDSSGNGNDGTLVEGPQWVDGKSGSALEVDGDAAYVDFGNDSSLNPTDELTVQRRRGSIAGYFR